MIQPSSLFVVDADVRSLETLTFGFEREGCKVTGTSDLKRAALMARTAGAELAVVSVREPERSALDVVSELRGVARDLPVVVLGPPGARPEALRAGAADFLVLPAYLRDVIGVGKLSVLGEKAEKASADPGPKKPAEDLQTRLSQHYGLFYLLRAMASAERSGVVALTRGSRRAELRIHEGTVVSVSVGAMQGLPALHHLLLWEEAAASLSRRAVPKQSQLHLSAQEVLDECERFLRDFAHAARDLGSPRSLYGVSSEPVTELRGLQPSQVTPLLRLFDGRRVLADVIEESPFRIFDTVRMIRRLRDYGVLVARADEPGREKPRDKRTMGTGPTTPLNGASKSMLAEWAMVPDQRGVVGDRRTTSRKLRPLDPKTPPPVAVPAAAPIPLTAKKGSSAAGEIAVKRSPTPVAGSTLGEAPTVQVQLDAAGAPVGAPLVPSDPASFPPLQTPPPVRARSASGRQAPLDAPVGHDGTPPPVRARSASGRHSPLDAPARHDGTPPPVRTRGTSGRQAPVGEAPTARTGRTPIPTRRGGSGRQAPLEDAPSKSERTERPSAPRKVIDEMPPGISADQFDAIEADFFAREADLYKREALETFDDLDTVAGIPGRRPPKK